MEIREGYKQTEVGVIPQDWDLKTFGDVITVFSSGATPYRGHPEYYKGNIRWISSGELNYNIITDTKEKITEEAVQRANLKVHPSGTFLIAITGLEAEGTRGRCGFVGLPSTTNQSCMALYPIKVLLDSKYLFHYYLWQGDNLAFKYCQGTKQQSYTANIAKKLPIILPILSEQQAIAEVLSDTENLVQSLEKQIEKKRLIKQGVMQKLLTPQDGWRVMNIRDLIYSFQNGYGFSAEGYVNNGIPIVTMAQIGLDGSFQFDYNKVNFWKSSDFNALKSYHLKDGDLIIAMTDVTPEKNLIGRMTIVKSQETLLLNQRVGHLRVNNDRVNPFILCCLSNMDEWRNYSIASASLGVQANIGTKDILNGLIELPSIEEQNRIADIIIDFDTEISVFENKLYKYKSFKQGLMQNLLTGKIRLTKI